MESLFLSLAVLACPVGMGLMMWFMARGTRRDEPTSHHPATGDVEDLRAEHRRLGTELERLETRS